NDALIDAPLALAEARTTGLRRIYAKSHRDAWDGSAVFRDAVAKHGGIQLDPEKRRALVHPLTMLMWGELGAWIVSAELAERLQGADPRPPRRGQPRAEALRDADPRRRRGAGDLPLPRGRRSRAGAHRAAALHRARRGASRGARHP